MTGGETDPPKGAGPRLADASDSGADAGADSRPCLDSPRERGGVEPVAPRLEATREGVADPESGVRPWPIWKLSVLLYPAVAAAVAVNLFLLGLIASYYGLGSLAPKAALAWSVPLGVPAAWASGRWLRTLLDRADDAAGP